MEKEPLKIGVYTIAEWYRAAFALIGFLFVSVIVLEGVYFILKSL